MLRENLRFEKTTIQIFPVKIAQNHFKPCSKKDNARLATPERCHFSVIMKSEKKESFITFSSFV